MQRALMALLVLVLIVGDLSCEKREIKELKNKGLSLDAPSFIAALRERRSDDARLFVAAGIDPNTTDEVGRPVLAYAAMMGDIPLMEALFAKGAAIDKADRDGQTALKAALLEGTADAVTLLVERGAEINPKKAGDLTPLMIACNKGHKERPAIVAYLIKKGADVNARDMFGRTPLMYAVGKVFKQTTELLVAAGADVNARDGEGRHILFYLTGNGERTARDEIVAYLKGKGSKDEQSETEK